MQFLHGTKIDFVGKRGVVSMASAALIAVFAILTVFLGLPLGIDFQGGTEIAIAYSSDVSTDQVRSALEKSEFGDATLKSFGKPNQFLIRTAKAGNDLETKVVEAAKQATPQAEVTLLKSDKIEAKIGSEMRSKALLAIVVAVACILVYIAFRFEFVFGVGAIIALIHDVLFAFSVSVVFGQLGIISFEVDQNTVAALLTVVGFSINDTVIIFDRIRENREIHKGMPLPQLVNLSLNETLSRTINTSLTAVGVLLVIVFFGGAVLQGLAFTMLVGFLVGTYSSIYIATNYVLWAASKKSKNAELQPTR